MMIKNFTISLLLFVMVTFNTTTAQVIYVNHSATGNGTGTNWANAYTTISDAVASAVANDKIWVAKGTYYPATAAQQNNPLLITVDDVDLIGGFAGTETSITQRDITKIHTDNATIISGDYQDNDISGDFASNRSDNAKVLVQLSAHDITIDGFTLTGAHSPGNTSADGNNVIKASTNINVFTLQNCNITDNYTGYIMFDWRTFNTNLYVKNTAITGNTAQSGLMLLQHSSSQNDNLNVLFVNVLVADNTYFSDWGAIWFRRVTSGNSNGLYSFIINSTFANNTNTHSSAYENTINISGDGDNQISIWNTMFSGNKFQTNNLSTYDIRNNKQSEGNSVAVNFQNSYIGLPGLSGDVSSVGFTNSSPISTAPQLDAQYKPIAGSSSIDAGLLSLYNQAAYPLTDLAGNTRVVNSLIDVGAFEYQGVTCATEVNIPDANFKTALLNHNPVIDTNNDGIICLDEAQAFTGALNVSNSTISDLTGIEEFTSITQLFCENNNLSNIDVSNNTALQRLSVPYNNLTSLNISGLSNLNILECYENSLTSLDISSNTSLTDCYANSNQIDAIDASLNTALVVLDCDVNNLTSLNVANGNNANMQQMRADINSNLTCIQIDAGFTPNSNWIKDATASYSTDCSGSACATEVNIPDANFKTALLNHNPVIDTNNDGIICLDEAQAYTGNINVSNSNISDLTGIEEFTNIEVLWCSDNNLTNIDVSNNTMLTFLNINDNNIAALDLSNLNNLVQLNSINNSLTNIDLSNNVSLEQCYLSSNQIGTIDASMNPFITHFTCHFNNLTSLNLANGHNLNMQYMQADNNPNLTCIQIDAGFTPNSSWMKDATASYSTDCSITVIDQISNNDISVYYSSDNQYVSISNIDNLKQVDVYNSIGIKVKQTKQYSFSINDLATGVYIVKILDTQNQTFTKKILKQY